MATPQPASPARSDADRQAEFRDFWERRADGSTEPRKAAFADTITSLRRRLGKRKHRP